MPKFIVERNIPGADKLTAAELCDISAKSNAVVDGLGVPYVWHHTYAAGDKLYCVHEANSADDIYRHAKEGGFLRTWYLKSRTRSVRRPPTKPHKRIHLGTWETMVPR
ncbi:nickel-binding protein [Sulfitobacter sediminilitoris]|uniref:nickel-binding protein n=1 Tax=Sulfitobacter sediminilitoris TaxID=2698830 RepID=UPI00361F8C03